MRLKVQSRDHALQLQRAARRGLMLAMRLGCCERMAAPQRGI